MKHVIRWFLLMTLIFSLSAAQAEDVPPTACLFVAQLSAEEAANLPGTPTWQGWQDVTPAIVREQTDWRIVKLDLQYSYLLQGDQYYPLCTMWGGWGVTSALPWDYDDNGVLDLLYTYSWGSGLHRSHVTVFDMDVKDHIDLDGWLEDAALGLMNEDGSIPVFDCAVTSSGSQPILLQPTALTGHVRRVNGHPEYVSLTPFSDAFSDAVITAFHPVAPDLPVDNDTHLSELPPVSLAELDAVFGETRALRMLDSRDGANILSIDELQQRFPSVVMRQCADEQWYLAFPVEEGGSYIVFCANTDSLVDFDIEVHASNILYSGAIWLRDLPDAAACDALIPRQSTAEDLLALTPAAAFAQGIYTRKTSWTPLSDGSWLHVIYVSSEDGLLVTDTAIVPAEKAAHFTMMTTILPQDLP